MSLQFLGIRRNGSASPTTRSFSISSSTHELADDSKDVLVQRLNDLAVRLSSEDYLEDQDVSALHTDVDRMERILKHSHAHDDNHSQAPQSPLRAAFSHYPTSPIAHAREESYSPAALSPLRAAFSFYGGSPSGRTDGEWAPLSPPSPSSSFHLSDSPQRHQLPRLETAFEFTKNPTPKDSSTKRANVLAKEAGILQTQLANAVRELTERKEEMGHIQDVLITRSEKAAQRVIQLENELRSLQEEYTQLLSNLSYLRIQLRSLEVRGEQHIPYNADAELAESIRNWKLEWADVDMKIRSAKTKATDALQHPGGVVIINGKKSG